MDSPLDELWPHFRLKLGDHCLRYKEYKAAKENYQTSLSLDPEKLDSVCCLSREFAHEGKLDLSLQTLSSVDHKRHFKCNLQECDCWYESNDFEKNILKLNEYKAMVRECKIEIPFCTKRVKAQQHDGLQKGPKLSELNRRFDLVTTNYADTIGKRAGNCVYNQRKYFDKVCEIRRVAKQGADTTPIVMRDAHVCSDFENQKPMKDKNTPKDKRHNEIVHRIFAQSYMQSAWKDFDFLKKLGINKTLRDSTQNAETQEKIRKAVDECTSTTSVMIKQLHARCPLYSKRYQAILNPTRAENLKQLRVSQLRNEIDFTMMSFLATLAKCREDENLKKLLKSAEHELTTRLRLYPIHLTPRRDDYVADICNYIALGYIDDLIAKLSALHVDNKTPDDRDLLTKMFGVDFADGNAIVAYRFGDQSTFREPGDLDKSGLKGKDNSFRIDRRMKQKPMLKIELCYLTHELAWENLKKMRVEDARTNGRRVVESAEGVSLLWMFLGLIMVCRVNVLQQNFKKFQKSLLKAQNLAKMFKSKKLEEFLDVAMEINLQTLLRAIRHFSDPH